MSKTDNEALRKKKNEHFIKAFKFIAQSLNMSQEKLAEAIDSKSSYISMYKNGRKPVPTETIENLINFSCKHKDKGLQIFSEYLYGNSDIMLLDNVSDEEMSEAILRKNNPDYDTMKKRREEKEKEIGSHINETNTYIDEGSMINMTISSYMGYIESLKQQVKDVRADLEREKKSAAELIERERKNADERISELKSQINILHAQLADKDAIIAEKNQRLRDYRHILDAHNLLDKMFPFNIGSAEPNNVKI